MRNKTFKIVGTIVIVGGIIFFTHNVEAKEFFSKFGDKFKENSKQGVVKMQHFYEGKEIKVDHKIDRELSQSIRQAIEEKNYDKWKKAILKKEAKYPSKRKWLGEIRNEEDFLAFAEEMKSHHNKMEKRHEHRQAIQEAIANNDYEEWKVLVSDLSENNLKEKTFVDIKNHEDFEKLVRMYELKAEIQAIQTELGLNNLGKKNKFIKNHK